VPVSEPSEPSELSELSEPSEPSNYPKELFLYSVLRVSIPILNMYLSQTYSTDDCDEEESLKTNTKCIRICIRLMLKRLC
jgi:hypothetical protein